MIFVDFAKNNNYNITIKDKLPTCCRLCRRKVEKIFMIVIITEFAREREVEPDTVTTFIRRHPEIQKDIIQKGKKSAIDTESEGYEALEKQYPLPKPIQVIEDTESRKELIQTQKLVIQLQNKLNEATTLIAQAEAQKILLEDKQQQLDKAEEREQKAEETIRNLSKELDQVRMALETEKNKTWIDKLLKR